jgi:hypothetical protein
MNALAAGREHRTARADDRGVSRLSCHGLTTEGMGRLVAVAVQNAVTRRPQRQGVEGRGETLAPEDCLHALEHGVRAGGGYAVDRAAFSGEAQQYASREDCGGEQDRQEASVQGQTHSHRSLLCVFPRPSRAPA